jgi:hypothetical protein
MKNWMLGLTVVGLLSGGAANAATFTYDFAGAVSGTNTLLGASNNYSSTPAGAPTITLTAGQYSGTIGTPTNTTFLLPAAFRLVGNNRGTDEQGVGVCGAAAPYDCTDVSNGMMANRHQLQTNGELDYSQKEVIRVDLTALFALYSNFTVNADSATSGEQLGVFTSNLATNLGTKLTDITSAQNGVVVTPQHFLYFLSDSNSDSGDVLLRSLTVTLTDNGGGGGGGSLPEPAGMAILGVALAGLGWVKRRRKA